MQTEDLIGDRYASLSTSNLLIKVIGRRGSRQFNGSLRPFFDPDGEGNDKCLAAKELVKRWLEEQAQRDDVLSNPSAVRDYLRLHYAGREFESFVVVFLDAQNRVINAEELFRGTLTQTSVYPREVVKAALRHNAASVLLSHNHPSGVAEPSLQDQALTRTLADALALIDVKVLDHFVIAGQHAISFAERGLV